MIYICLADGFEEIEALYGKEKAERLEKYELRG